MGFPVRHEPKNIDSLCRNKEVFVIFEEVRWIEYFQILNGFHEETTLHFFMNLIKTHSYIRGLRIDVLEASLA